MATVLVVDDSISMRKNLRIFLKDLGHSVIAEASNGKEAFNLYSESKPDLVTMDISMPTMDGISSVRMILEKFPEANIVMITALSQRSSVYEALKSGAKGYIVKPIELNKLREVIEIALNSPKRELHKTPPATADSESSKPFSIENVSGKFIVRVSEKIDPISYNLLNEALNGIMYIKPLDITFDLGEENLDYPIYSRILKTAKKINDEGGIAVVKSSYFIP